MSSTEGELQQQMQRQRQMQQTQEQQVQQTQMQQGFQQTQMQQQGFMQAQGQQMQMQQRVQIVAPETLEHVQRAKSMDFGRQIDVREQMATEEKAYRSLFKRKSAQPRVAENDPLGYERREHMKHYQTSSAGMEAAVQKDTQNLVGNLQQDQQKAGMEVNEQKAVRQAKQLIEDSPQGVYRDRMLETLSDKLETQKMEEELLSSKKKFWKFTLDDGKEMQEVKWAIGRHMGLMQKGTVSIGDDGSIPEDELKDALARYDDLVKACQGYLDHINWVSGGQKEVGERRMKLVSRLRSQIRMEKLALEHVAKHSVRDAVEKGILQKGCTWSEVLYLARARKIEKKNVEMGGSGTSIVYKLKNEDGTFSYMKAEEKMREEDNPFLQLADYEGMVDGWAREFVAGLAKVYRGMTFNEGEWDSLWANAAESIKKMKGVEALRTVMKGLYDAAEKNEEPRKSCMKALAEAFEHMKPAEGSMEDEVAIKLDFVQFIAKRELARQVVYNRARGHMTGDVTVTNRNVSTSRIVSDLGADDVIAKSETAVFEKDGRLMRMNVMEEATGMDMNEIVAEAKAQNKRLEYTPEALNQISKMRILDLICGQVDRNRSNYKVQSREDPNDPNVWKIVSVKGIDNDMSFGELDGAQIIRGAGALVPINDLGEYTLPFLEEEFWHTLQAYTPEQAAAGQVDLRTDAEINALKERIVTVKAEIQKGIDMGKIQVIKKADIAEKGLPAAREMKKGVKTEMTLRFSDNQCYICGNYIV